MSGFVQAVAVDLDGTIARDGQLDVSALEALDACRSAGIATVLVTGRIESELVADFPELLEHFDAAVLENGPVVTVGDHRVVAAVVDRLLAPKLRDKQVTFREGEAILACHGSDTRSVLDGINELGLDAQLVHNRSELMVLPAGVSKGTGLAAALAELGISEHNAIAIGDAENDLSMLAAVEIGVAAPGSVESVRRVADVLLSGQPGQTVADFLRGPVVSGAQPVRAARRGLRIGRAVDGSIVTIPGAQAGILVCGESGSGKSHVTGLLVERWIDAGYTVLVVDPEGDHASLADLDRTVVLEAGGSWSIDELVRLLRQGSMSVVLDLSGMDSSAVPVLAEIADAVEKVRHQHGLPHWVVIDEAHGVLGENGGLAHIFRPIGGGYCYVTYRPESLCAAARTTVDVTITALGSAADGGVERPPRAVIRTPGRPDKEFYPDARATAHVRHRRKYRDIALPDRMHFHFRDPSGKIFSSAATIAELVEQIESAPDGSIVHHALRGDFSRWAAGAIQDRSLSSQMAAAEAECSMRMASAAATFRKQAGANLAERYGVSDSARTSRVGMRP